MTKKIKIISTKSPFLTKGQTYQVWDEGVDYIEIQDDSGDVYVVLKENDPYVYYVFVEEGKDPPSTFSKKDLVAGKHVVVTADGDVGLVVDVKGELWVCFDNDTTMELCDQEEDLSYPDDEALDIVEVYQLESSNIGRLFNLKSHTLVWKKEETRKEMTIKEIEEALGYKIEIVDATEYTG